MSLVPPPEDVSRRVTHESPVTTSGLRRTLTTWDLTLLVLGNVIGSGIFIVPSVVLRQSGSVGVAFAVWVVGGVLSLFGALAYAELGAMDRSAGGLYAYIRDGFGSFVAFLFGWTMFFGIGGGSIAALTVAATDYLGQFVTLGVWGTKATALAIIAVIGAITISGIRSSASVQNWGALIKSLAVIVMSVILLAMGHGGAGLSAAPPDGGLGLFSAAGTAMISVLWAYEGWQYVTFSAGETVNPQRSLPVAISLGTAAIVAIYLLANVGYLAALGPAAVASSERVAADAMTVVLGEWAGRLIAAAIIIAMCSASLSIAITMPRAYYSMAQDGLFFRSFARVHPKYGTPANAIAGLCIWSGILAISGTFTTLLAYEVFVGWIFYALGAAAVVVLRRKRPDTPRPFRVPGYPVTPILFILAAAALVVNTIVAQPKVASIGLAMVFAGAPAYLFWRRKAATSD